MQDSESFINELYTEYFFQICAYCEAMLNGDETGALDCAHEVFDVARNSAAKLKNHPNIIGWLKLTAQNRVRRALRKKGVRLKRERNIDDLLNNRAQPLQYTPSFDESDSNITDLAGAINRVLICLTDDELVLYTLRYKERMTYKQIAKKLNIPESTIRMRTLKVELKLRSKALEQETEGK